MLRRAAVWSGWLDVVRNAVRTARALRTSCLVMTLPAPVTRAADAVMTGPMLIEWIASWLLRRGVDAVYAEQLAVVASISTLLLCAWIVNFVTKRIILRVVSGVVRRTTIAWDDVFLKVGVFTRLSHVAPALVVTLLGPEFFLHSGRWANWLAIAVNIYFILIVVLVVHALLDAVVELIESSESTKKGMPIKSFVQGAKLVLVMFAGILVLSLMLSRSPVYFLSGLGALTAVLLLVFKDVLLGLVAGVQISVSRMIQIGDWIEMEKYGADGFVIDVSLTTVRVENWDKTVTTVPTYALIADPVKNWRAMFESGGRRIKRSIFLDMESIRFVDEALLDKMLSFARLRPYLEQKLPELEAWNQQEQGDLSVLVNGRRLTNVGCFRAYVTAYLRAHDQIHQNMTFLVRQLQPTDKGLPLEIYVFTKDTRWAFYEGIQADIFDHLLAVLSEFDLSVYQSPSGKDVRRLALSPEGAAAAVSGGQRVLRA